MRFSRAGTRIRSPRSDAGCSAWAALQLSALRAQFKRIGVTDASVLITQQPLFGEFGMRKKEKVQRSSSDENDGNADDDASEEEEVAIYFGDVLHTPRALPPHFESDPRPSALGPRPRI